jgi:hypothetical protein
MSQMAAVCLRQQESRFEAAEQLFQRLVADPAWGLSLHDRELFHAFLCSIGREAAERLHSRRPVRDPDGLAMWWLGQRRASWSLRIDRRDRHRAKRIIDYLDAKAAGDLIPAGGNERK